LSNRMNDASEEKKPQALSFLIILMGSLGDVTRGLCLVSHIKSNLPGSRITWLVEPKCAELVKFHPEIDRVIVFKRTWKISSLTDLCHELSNEHFDIVLDLQRHFKSGVFSLLSGAERRLGFNPRNAKEFNWIFNREHIEPFDKNMSKLVHYLKFTEYLGIPEPDSLDFGFSSFDPEPYLSNLPIDPIHPFIAVVMGSSWVTKDWLPDQYLELVEIILGAGSFRVVLLGDRFQMDLAGELSRRLDSPGLVDMTGKTSLKELTAILKKASIGVGPDSGPGHIAAAVGTPYVSLFGPTSPDRVAPYGCRHLVVRTGEDCSPCNKKKCPYQNRPCMSKIGVEAVMETIHKALSEID